LGVPQAAASQPEINVRVVNAVGERATARRWS
jgi:hypothetical protein